jgi:heptosyltransferase-3
LKEIDADIQLAVLANPSFGSLFEENNWVDSFIPFESGNENPWEEAIRSFAPEVSIHCHPEKQVAALCAQAGVRMRVGYEADAPHLTHAIPDTRTQGERHELEYVLDLINVCGAKLTLDECQPCPNGASLPDGMLTSSGYAVIHLGSHGAKATVPQSIYQELANWLVEKYDLDIVLIGTGEETHLSEEFIQGNDHQNRVSSLCGKLIPAQTFGLLKGARLFLGRDSGPAHLAAAAGTETFVIMPATRPDISVKRWKPLGPKVTVIGLQGEARFWEKTEQANQRVFDRIDVAKVKAQMIPQLQSLGI